MKKLASKGIAIIVLVALIMAVIIGSNLLSKKYDENNAGREVKVDWTYVNVRQGPYEGTEIIGQLHLGEKVVLTGHEKNYWGGKGEAIDSWVEIQLADGTIGWTVRAAYENF